MKYTVGIDVGTTYTKALILDQNYQIAGRGMKNTGFKLGKAARTTFELCLE